MPFNSMKVSQLAKERGMKVKEFFAKAYPERGGTTNHEWKDILKTKNPTAKTIENIADMFGVSIDYLFDREVPQVEGGDNIHSDHNSIAFKGTYTCDARLLEMIAAKDRQIDQLLGIIEQLQKGEAQK